MAAFFIVFVETKCNQYFLGNVHFLSAFAQPQTYVAFHGIACGAEYQEAFNYMNLPEYSYI